MSLCSFLFIFEINILKIKEKMSKFFGHFSKIDKAAFWVCLTISVTLLTASFLLPPTGQIDSSVIGAVGELFGFVTLAVVIKALGKGTDVVLHRGDLDISLNNPDSDKDEK